MTLIQDFDDLDINARDPGDGKYTSNKVFNLCFIPDADSDAARNYSQRVIEMSAALARNSLSAYTLDELPAANSTIHSHPHATISHFVVTPEVNLYELSSGISTLIGVTQMLSIRGIYLVEGAPFDRLAKASRGAFQRVSEETTNRAICVSIGLTDEFRSIQTRAHETVLDSSGGKALCISPYGDASTPHHSAYSQKAVPGDTGVTPSLPWHIVPRPQRVRHKVVLGTCGPWGQVTEYVARPDGVESFLKRHTELSRA